MPSRIARLALVACSGLALCASAYAQPAKDATKPGDALKGPAVNDRQVPGVEGSFGEPGGERKRFIGENRLPPRAFRDAMEPVLSPDAPDNLRVTEEQRERFRGWMDNFQKDFQAYMREHQKEIRQLRQQMGEQGPGPRGPGRRPKDGKGPDAKPDGNDEMRPPVPPVDEKQAASAREQMQAIMQGAPKIEDLYTKIWTELKPEQQKAVDAKLDEFRAEQAKEREERYVRERAGKGKKAGEKDPTKPGDQKGPPPPRRGPNGQTLGPGSQPDASPDRPFARIDPQRRERLARLFSQLPPEEQDRLLDRIEQFMRDRAGQPGRPNAERGGEPKPPPDPDDSMLPPGTPKKD